MEKIRAKRKKIKGGRRGRCLNIDYETRRSETIAVRPSAYCLDTILLISGLARMEAMNSFVFRHCGREKQPSFGVNRERNIFQDFGCGGGTEIDFVVRYRKMAFRGALSRLERFSKVRGGERYKNATAGIYEANRGKSATELSGLSTAAVHFRF